MLSRRKFISIGALGVVSLMGLPLFGCSANASNKGNASHGDESKEDVENMNTSESSSANESTPGGSTGSAAVVFFSATGNTQRIANLIAEDLGVQAQEIVPAVPYSSTDLDYGDDSTRATAEARDSSARPELAQAPVIPADCDVVFLGYPIWWGVAASPVRTYVEGADLTGKTIIPFCTSGSSPISSADLQALAPGDAWKNGRRFSASASPSEISAWIDELNL